MKTRKQQEKLRQQISELYITYNSIHFLYSPKVSVHHFPYSLQFQFTISPTILSYLSPFPQQSLIIYSSPFPHTVLSYSSPFPLQSLVIYSSPFPLQFSVLSDQSQSVTWFNNQYSPVTVISGVLFTANTLTRLLLALIDVVT